MDFSSTYQLPLSNYPYNSLIYCWPMNFPENNHEFPSFSITALPLQTQLGGRSDGSLKTVSPFTRCCTAMGIANLVPQGAPLVLGPHLAPFVDVSEQPREPINPSRVSRVFLGLPGLRANPKGYVPEGVRGLKGSLDRFATQLHHSHLRGQKVAPRVKKGHDSGKMLLQSCKKSCAMRHMFLLPRLGLALFHCSRNWP